ALDGQQASGDRAAETPLRRSIVDGGDERLAARADDERRAHLAEAGEPLEQSERVARALVEPEPGIEEHSVAGEAALAGPLPRGVELDEHLADHVAVSVLRMLREPGHLRHGPA